MSYTITRENAARDLEALKAILDNDGIVEGDVKVLEEIADSIEEQVKPVVEEPTEPWSVISANVPGSHFIEPRQLVLTSVGWIDAAGNGWGDFATFSDVEVLRVGIGEPTLTEEEIDKQAADAQGIIHAVNSVAAGEIVPPDHELAAYYDEMNRVDDANTDYLRGVEDFAAKVRREIAALRSTVVTVPEKRTCDDALALVAALMGES